MTWACDDDSPRGATLEQVARFGFVRIAEAQCDFTRHADVGVVGVALAVAVAGQVGVLDQDFAVRKCIARHQAILAVVQVNVPQREVFADEADRCAVLVGA